MDLTKILAISGRPGLYSMISQAKNGVIVESLTDGKRSTAFAHERVSSLEEISVFTTGEDLLLRDVFKRIYDKLEGGPAEDPKSEQTDLKAYFAEFIPEFDSERVYASDIRKIITWYNLLVELKMMDFTEEEKTEEEKTEEGKTEEETGTPEEKSE